MNEVYTNWIICVSGKINKWLKARETYQRKWGSILTHTHMRLSAVWCAGSSVCLKLFSDIIHYEWTPAFCRGRQWVLEGFRYQSLKRTLLNSIFAQCHKTLLFFFTVFFTLAVVKCDPCFLIMHAALLQAWRRYDTDRSGYIESNELKVKCWNSAFFM